MKLLLVAALTIPFLSQPHAGAAEEYPIKLTRKFEVGQKFSISATAGETRKLEVTVNGNPTPPPPAQNVNMKASLEGVEEILAVKENGAQSKSRLLIQKCLTKSEGQDEENVFESGTMVDLTFGEAEVSFQADGKAVSPEQSAVLSKFFETKKAGTDDDELLGTDEKQAVGDKWIIDNQTAAKSLSENGMKLGPEDIDGWMKLEAVVERDGIRYLDIRGEINLKKMAAPMPPGMAIKKSGGKMTIRGLFPVEGNSQAINKQMTMTFAVDAGGDANGSQIELSMRGRTHRDGSMKVLE